MDAEAPRQVHPGAGGRSVHDDNTLEIRLVFPGTFAISGFHVEDLSEPGAHDLSRKEWDRAAGFLSFGVKQTAFLREKRARTETSLVRPA
jgi:hypothetical protein